MTEKRKLAASLSLDLDNEWSYMQTAGDTKWDEYSTYLPEIVPRILEFFESHDTRLTFFIVGKDAERQENHEALKSIVAAGHEVGNHSFGHEPWLHEYSFDQIDEELAKAEVAIEGAMGVRPNMFRGPGYSYSTDVLRALHSRGYRFDASSFPNVTASLARLYLFSKTAFGQGDKEQRSEIFGRKNEMFRSVRPYQWDMEPGALLEIPVTTMPFFKIPFHFSYILYLAEYSESIAMLYFRFAIWLCSIARVEPSLLFHPLDFMGIDDARESVAFFPGMKRSSEQKVRLLHRCIEVVKRRFELLPMGEHASRIDARGGLKLEPCEG